MSSRTWVYVIILIIVLAAGGAFFWWMYRTSKITPKAAVTPTPTPQTFSDVSPSYWAYKEIEAVNKAGYMTGYFQFKPDQAVTRADAAAAIAKAYSKSYDNPTPSFSDVPKTHWAYKEIEGLKQAAWIEGTNGAFKPDQKATRAELAIFISSAHAGGIANVGKGPTGIPPIYTDVNESTPNYDFIFYTKQYDLMSGYPDGSFKPDQEATRADVASAVARAKAGGDAAVPQPSTTSFGDVPTDYWAYKYVEYCYVTLNKAMDGIKTFHPDDFSKRDVLAVALARADAGSEAAVPAGPAAPSFTDVPTDYWAYKHIEYLKSKDIVAGYQDGTFRPDTISQRWTIAVALARAKGLDLNAPPTTATFADVPTDANYFKEVEAIYKAGYTQGCGTDAATGKLKFCPTENLSRAGLAVFLYNGYLKPLVVSPQPSPEPSPSTPVPSPSPSAEISPTPTLTATPTVTTSPTTTKPAKTGPEIPLLGGGLLGLLFLARYLVGRKLK